MTRVARIALALLPFASLATGLSAQVGSPAGPVPVEHLSARRADLLKRMGNGIAIIRSSEQRSIEGDYPQDSDYRENNDFFYLTGNEDTNAVLAIDAPSGDSWLSCLHRARPRYVRTARTG